MEKDGFDESKLIERAKRGDTEAFGQLFDRYFDEIFRFLSAQIGRREDAEDIAVDVFRRTWEYLPRYKDKGYSFSAFLFSAARNALIDYYRRNNRRSQNEVELDESLPDGHDNPEDAVLLARQYQELYSALKRLPKNYREVLVLRFINDYSLEEIARIMRRKPGAVRVMQHRALKALGKLIDPEGGAK